MKKAYSKPEITFESFTLSTNIAGDCEKKTNTPAAMQCGYDIGTMVIFTANVSGCKENGATVVEDSAQGNDGWCYHAPEESYNLFNS